MIVKGWERGNGRQFGLYLLKDKNEHVEVHELRGFVATDLPSALQEIDAISRGTRTKNSMFCLVLNPPANKYVRTEDFEAAIDATEEKLGLQGQPRAVVFHEKDGARHAHAVWSRINAAKMKAINLPHFKLKLRDISRQLYMEHGWQMPRGLANSKERDPRNYSAAEWEQAKRAKQDPRALKALFQECWAISDNRNAFARALQARGYTLARGDRGHVAMDFKGEVYAVSKWVGLKAKEVRSKLGDAKELPTLETAQKTIADRMTDMLRQHVTAADRAYEKKTAVLAARRTQIVERQRKERTELETVQQQRQAIETRERASRLNKGFRGIWDRITGKHGKQARENEREALFALQRDRKEKDALFERQIVERRSFHQHAKQTRVAHGQEVAELHHDIAAYMRMGSNERLVLEEQFREASREQENYAKGQRHKDDPERSL